MIFHCDFTASETAEAGESVSFRAEISEKKLTALKSPPTEVNQSKSKLSILRPLLQPRFHLINPLQDANKLINLNSLRIYFIRTLSHKIEQNFTVSLKNNCSFIFAAVSANEPEKQKLKLVEVNFCFMISPLR